MRFESVPGFNFFNQFFNLKSTIMKIITNNSTAISQDVITWTQEMKRALRIKNEELVQALYYDDNKYIYDVA